MQEAYYVRHTRDPVSSKVLENWLPFLVKFMQKHIGSMQDGYWTRNDANRFF